ncbi:hypothetical protein BSL82_15690 [Tardibacter chloracetimidivorans]|uniref:Terminase n=2 Tax=Tardibacter chloracetimidivorans TaxID=1921510 RepID=A0A1L3ZY45_9SPHN|nr:hypothetical protein BSL82_15690 [Tardibacter chloracetimidivorans]
MLKISKADLTEKQLAFVQAYAEGCSPGEAALKSGYATREVGYQVVRSPAVQKALHEWRENMINTEGANLAIRTMIALMQPGNPGGVRFQAAKYMLDAAGHGPKDESGHAKELHEMTADELEAAISKLDSALAGKAEAAKPVNARVIEG